MGFAPGAGGLGGCWGWVGGVRGGWAGVGNASDRVTSTASTRRAAVGMVDVLVMSVPLGLRAGYRGSVERPDG
jgi:hypothetical protein